LENDRVLLNTLPVNYLKVKQMTVFLMRHGYFGDNHQSHIDEINIIKHCVCSHLLTLYPDSVFSVYHADRGYSLSEWQFLTAYFLDLPLMNSAGLAPDSRLNVHKKQLREFYKLHSEETKEKQHVIAVATQVDLMDFGIDVSWKYCTLWSKEDGVIYPGHLPDIPQY
jgi:hypothetical protein